MNLLVAFLAMMCGLALTTQVGNNTLLGKILGNEYIPGLANMVTGVLLTMVLVGVVVAIGAKPWPSAATASVAPWWTWVVGGSLGVIYLTGNILLAPQLGAGALVALVVTGQLLSAVVFDHFGWLGFAQHTATIWRGLGCVLMIGGLALIAKF